MSSGKLIVQILHLMQILIASSSFAADTNKDQVSNSVSSDCVLDKSDNRSNVKDYVFSLAADQISSWQSNHPGFEISKSKTRVSEGSQNKIVKRYEVQSGAKHAEDFFEDVHTVCYYYTASYSFTYWPKPAYFDESDCVNYFWAKHVKLGSELAKSFCTAKDTIPLNGSNSYSKCIADSVNDQDLAQSSEVINSCIVQSKQEVELARKMAELAEKKRQFEAEVEKNKQTKTFVYEGEDASVFSSKDRKILIHLIQKKVVLDLKAEGLSPQVAVLSSKHEVQGYVVGSLDSSGCFQFMEILSGGLLFSAWKNIPGMQTALGCNLEKIESLQWVDSDHFKADFVQNGEKKQVVVRSGIIHPLSPTEWIEQNAIRTSDVNFMPQVLKNKKSDDLFGFRCLSGLRDGICDQVQAVYYSKKNQIFYSFGNVMNSQFLDYQEFKQQWNWSTKVESVSDHTFLTTLKRFLR